MGRRCQREVRGTGCQVWSSDHACRALFMRVELCPCVWSSDHTCRALTTPCWHWLFISALNIHLEGPVVNRCPLHPACHICHSLLFLGSVENPFASSSSPQCCGCLWPWCGVKRCPLISSIRVGSCSQLGEETRCLCGICSLRKRK